MYGNMSLCSGRWTDELTRFDRNEQYRSAAEIVDKILKGQSRLTYLWNGRQKFKFATESQSREKRVGLTIPQKVLGAGG